MTQVDQFESVFRSAAKERFSFDEIALARVLAITDLGPEPREEFRWRLATQLEGLALGLDQDAAKVTALDPATWSSIRELLERVEEVRPDLLVTYRNLGSETWRWPYSLGEALDVLTQIAAAPVLVMPHPSRADEVPTFRATRTVMALTNHLTGDHRLVSWAARVVQPGGRLILAHIEDSADYLRYIDAISKIPSIDTAAAGEAILERLMKEPREYAESCRDGLAEAGLDLSVEGEQSLGHALDEVKRLIEAHGVDCLVFHTKDEGQLAMHGLAYSLAVEMRDIPLLLL